MNSTYPHTRRGSGRRPGNKSNAVKGRMSHSGWKVLGGAEQGRELGRGGGGLRCASQHTPGRENEKSLAGIRIAPGQMNAGGFV